MGGLLRCIAVHWVALVTLRLGDLAGVCMLQAEVDAFAARLQEHHTSSASADRLEAELARYGISCFHTHEVLYHRRIKTKVEQHTAAVVNELATKMRVLYRALVLPLVRCREPASWRSRGRGWGLGVGGRGVACASSSTHAT